jgi:energy-coupling factor transporter transmembrane protein EcfT
MGGLALLGSFVPFLNYFTGFLAFVGLVLGVIAIFLKARKKTLAIVASSVSLLALILSIVLAITYSRLFFDGIDSLESNYPTSTSVPVQPQDGSADEPVTGERGAPADEPATGEQGAPAVGDVGSRENPAPLGSSIELAQLGEPTWNITVGTPTLNADAAVAAENSFSDTAPAGTSFALVPITATYIGEEAAFAAYVQVGFEAADGTMYNEHDVIAVAPGAIDSISELDPGASVSGNIAIAIPATGVDQGLWVVSSLDGTKFYFAAR